MKNEKKINTFDTERKEIAIILSTQLGSLSYAVHSSK